MTRTRGTRREGWRAGERLERGGIKVEQAKIKHLALIGQEENIRLQEYDCTQCAKLSHNTGFEYLRTTMHQEGGCAKEVELKISEVWNKWGSCLASRATGRYQHS